LAHVSRSHLKAPRRLSNLDLRREIRLLSEQFLRFGYRRIHALLKAQGWQVNLKEAQGVIELWREHYNSERPHSTLGYLSPHQFIR
jgi:transposase InsO family protein